MPPKPTTTELHPSWDTARQYLAGTQQAFRLAIAGQVLLGMELMAIKKDLGYTHGANKGGPSGQFVHTGRTWSEWVTAELGISYKTADRMILMWDAARARIKKIGHTVGDLPGGTKKLALIVDARPSTLAEEDRERLSAVVERITDGTTQAALLEELRLVKRHAPPPDTTGIDNRTKKQSEDPVEQMAFNFWLGGGNQIMEIRASGSQYLNMLPIESSDPEKPSLRTLRAETAALLDDIEAAINANLKPAKGRTL
ncbi:MAG: hypothetical protein ACNA8L_10420 [Luteolibacter sp.]